MDSREPRGRAFPLPDANAVHRLLEFLPVLEAPDFTFAHPPSSPGSPADAAAIWGDDELTREAHRFVQALYDLGFVRLGFDWGEWQDEARRYVDDPTTLAGADLQVLCRLLTTHVRKDRFAAGHLTDMYECGHLVAVLRRLRELAGSGTL